MTQFWKTKKFSELYKEWNEILSSTGFIDIEKEINGERVLVQSASNAYRTTEQIKIEAKLEYFNLIGKYTYSERWMTPRDRIIMVKHSEGMMQKDILVELETRGLACHRDTVMRTIARYCRKWNLPSTRRPRKPVTK